MPVFSYRSTTMDGIVVEGVVEAADEKAAIERLKNKGFIPLQITAPREGVARRLRLRSAKGALLTFTKELAALLNAGLPLDRSLNILSGLSDSNEVESIVQSVLKSIREGSSFSDALQRHPKIFPRFYVNMIKAGEAGGVLEEVLDKLDEFLEAAKELKEHVISSMIYPSILIVTGGVSIIFLLTFVLPRFSVIFTEMGGPLPLATQVLLAVSNALAAYWWVILAGIGAAGMLFRTYLRTEAGRYRWDAIKLTLLGDVIRKLETARFCRTLGTLLRSGVPLLEALNNARDVIGNRVIASAIDTVSKGAKEGRGISAPLASAKVLPALALSLIKVGEETGQLDAMLIKAATIYERNLKVTIQRFMGLLEPSMILGMGLIIGFIVISMLMAIFSITELPF